MRPASLAVAAATGLVAAGIGLSAAYVAGRTKKKRRRETKAGRVETGYVGSGWVWPHRDVFPDQGSFGNALERLGYETGDWSSSTWTAQGPEMIAAVMQFQRDWNTVAERFMKKPELRILATGFIGSYTVEAILWALQRVELGGVSWPLFVDQVKRGSVMS